MKNERSYAAALAIAERVIEALKPACSRIEIAGSLRRNKAWIGDVEIVAVPKLEIERDMFGFEMGTVSLVDRALAASGWKLSKDGDRYKQFTVNDMNVDLFLCPDPRTWGVIFTLRTGSADFSHWLVTPKYAGGACLPGFRFQDGRIYHQGALCETPEEADVFRLLGVKWVEPSERNKGRWTAKRREPKEQPGAIAL